MIMISNAGFIYTKMIEQLFTVASVLAGDYTHRLESLHRAGYHVTQMAYGCSDYI